MISSPRDFLDLIRQAELVITSSFHGTAFSINFERPLITVSPSNGDDRQKSLLKTLGMESSMAINEKPVDTITPYYNYQKASDILETIREKQYDLFEKILR